MSQEKRSLEYASYLKETPLPPFDFDTQPFQFYCPPTNGIKGTQKANKAPHLMRFVDQLLSPPSFSGYVRIQGDEEQYCAAYTTGLLSFVSTISNGISNKIASCID